jgi:tellurium resistance protein TerD
MATVMRRGSNVALTREIPGLTGLVVGVNWQVGVETALADNLVMATILCDADSKAISDDHFVFFNQLADPDMSVSQLTRAVGGDAEQVEIHFAAVPAEVCRIVVVLYVNEGAGLRRDLGRLREIGVRALDLADNSELVRSENLAGALGAETAVSLCEVYRHNGGWKFKVIGEGYTTGIIGLAKDYGVAL